MTSDIAIFDAGPLIAFQQIDRLELLRGLFARTQTPPAVAQEFMPSMETLPRWIDVRAISTYPRYSRRLGVGERVAIALAIPLSADFVVLDDLVAKSVAVERDLTVIGSLGLLVKAKASGLIVEVRPLMDDMIAHGLYASDELYCQILSVAGEQV